MKKHLLGIIAGTALSCTAFAQQLPVMNHYIYNPYLFNPARTGQNDYGSINFNFKKQWVALPYSPVTAILSGEAPIKGTKIGDMGVGGMIYSDRMHVVDKIGGLVSYAYHIPFQKKKTFRHHLGIGLSMGVIHQRLDYPSATVANEADLQVLANSATGTAFDFSLGADYHWRDLHVGFSMLQGLNNGLKFINVNDKEIKYVNTRHFMLMTSYRFRLMPPEKKHRFYIEPVFLGRIVPGVPFQAEANLLFGMEGIAWLGFGYRSSNLQSATAAIDITFGAEIMRRFVFAYSLEMGVDAQLNTSMGTQHEFMLAYRFNTGNKKMEEKMQAMEEKIQQMKTVDSLTLKRLTETENVVNQQQTTIDSLRMSQEELKRISEEQNTKLKSQQELLNSHEQRLDKHDADIDELRKAIQKNPLQYKKLGEVFFESGSASLDKTATANLDATKGMLTAKPNAKIYLYGHASTDGNAKSNQELSVRRAAAVRQYLISAGIPAERIEMLPFGAENPAGGDTNKVESRDRRVEIIISEGDQQGKL